MNKRHIIIFSTIILAIASSSTYAMKKNFPKPIYDVFLTPVELGLRLIPTHIWLKDILSDNQLKNIMPLNTSVTITGMLKSVAEYKCTMTWGELIKNRKQILLNMTKCSLDKKSLTIFESGLKKITFTPNETKKIVDLILSRLS